MKRLSIPLTALLLTGSALPHADAIVPVPLHKKRLWKREFNQTALIGRHLARGLKIPLRMDMLKKVKETIPQTDVRGAERSKNVRGSFAAAGRIQGLRLILIDDVITTGATVTECAKVLRKAGAAEVIVVALARSMPKY
jgi:ComF family protein